MGQINTPNGQRRPDALSQIAQGLQIAGQVYGIKTNMAQLDRWDQEDQDKKDFAAGKLNKGQQLAYGKDFDISSEAPVGQKAAQYSDAESGSPLWLSSKKDQSPLIHSVMTTKNGQIGNLTVDLKTGKELAFIPAPPPAAREPKTVQIQTLDANGNPVISLVEDRPGQQFPMINKADDKIPNKDQFDAASYGKRIQQANNILNDLTASGYNRQSTTQSIASTLLPDSFKGDQLKQQEQAERNFVNAVLRRESGAAISQSEFDSAKLQYFPRAGDTPDVLAQKSQNRDQALENFKAASGNAWAKIPEVPLKKASASTTEEGTAMAAPAGSTPHTDDAALKWLQANPNDPAADSVRATLKAKGIQADKVNSEVRMKSM